MLSKLTLIVVAAFAAFAAASPVARSQCNTGTQQCCGSVQSASSAAAAASDTSLINALQSLAPDVLVGLDCSPIQLIPIGSPSQCTQSPTCCERNIQDGLINVGCTPIGL